MDSWSPGSSFQRIWPERAALIESRVQALRNTIFLDVASLAHCQNFSAAGLSRALAGAKLPYASKTEMERSKGNSHDRGLKSS